MDNNKEMHIGLFIPSMRGGGAEKVFSKLANEFTRRKFKVDLLLAQKEGPYLKSVSKDVNIIALQSSRVLNNLFPWIKYLKSLFPLINYLKKDKPDVLISTLTHVNIIAIAAKIISGIQINLIIREANHYKLPSNKMRMFLEKYLLKKADLIIAVSQGVKNSLIEELRIPEQKIKVIYNPVYNESIIERSKEEIDHPFFHNKNKIILGAGRLHKVKDFPTLIKAFSIMKNDSNRLIILGEGEKREELENLVRELNLEDYVSMPGFVDNPYAFMSRADVFVMSSLHEGLPNVLIEAMSCGSNVVSTDCPSGPFEILDGGKYGKLVTVGNIEKLSEAILDTLQHPMDKRILLNRAKFFSIEKAADEYHKLFTELIYNNYSI